MSPSIPDNESHGDWKIRLLAALRAPDAPRAVKYGELFALTRTVRPSITPVTMRGVLDAFVDAGALRRVGGGLYLNQECAPKTSFAEALHRIRSGAVLSLQSVLGDAGVTNNPTSFPTAVVPIGGPDNARPNVGEHVTEERFVARFHGLPWRFFPEAMGDDVLDPMKPCPCFRPEKALLDWLHLGTSKHSKLTSPPVEIDLDMLEMDRLHDFARRLDMTEELDAFLERAHAADFGRDPEDRPALTPRPRP